MTNDYDEIGNELLTTLGGDLSALDVLAQSIVTKTCARPVPLRSGLTANCKCRISARCPACSYRNKALWLRLISQGIEEAVTEGEYHFYLLTLTAPGAPFGRVHYCPDARKSHEPRRCPCGVYHSEADAGLSGTPVNFQEYRYLDQARWNFMSSDLWNATRSRLKDAYPGLAYVAARELQPGRLAAHMHIIGRLDRDEAPSPHDLAQRAQSATCANPFDGSTVQWGPQVQCDLITTAEDCTKSMFYVTKTISYAIKDYCLAGRDGEISPEKKLHAMLLTQAAKQIDCGGSTIHTPDGDIYRIPCGENCKRNVHRNFGVRSHPISYSKGWAFGLTKGQLHQAQKDYAAAQENQHNPNNQIAEVNDAREYLAWAHQHLAKPDTQQRVSKVASNGGNAIC